LETVPESGAVLLREAVPGREEELPLEEEAVLLAVEADTPQKGRRHSWRWRCCQRWRRRCSWRSRRYSWRRQQRRQRRRRRCR
jgi:hypothetical protein